MPSRRRRFGTDDRGISEVTATALLVGIVILGAVIVVAVGGSLVTETDQQTTDQTAEVVVQELDSRLETLAQSRDTTRIGFDLGDTKPKSVEVVEDGGYLNVTVNGRTSECSTEVPLSSVRYEGDRATVAYEGGGVFRQSGTNASTVLTDPDVNYRHGTVDIQLVNLSGHVDQTSTEATLNVSSSRTESDRRTRRVLSGGCVRPDNVTITVRSDFYRAWGAHLEGETNESVDYYDSNSTVRVTLHSDSLPEAADDRRNAVVNLSNGSYMHKVNVTNTSIEVSKNLSRQYSVSMTPVNDQRPGIGKVERIETATNITRPPLDVVFVMDDSGSMSGSKIQNAKDSAQSFHSELNASKDRTGVVGYDSSARYMKTDGGKFLTSDFSASGTNGSIDDLNAGGGTAINRGLSKGTNLLTLRSNETRNSVIVLLTDGKNNPEYLNDDTIDQAHVANNSGQTVYTIGFGGNQNETLLKRVANITGGEYYAAADADELDEAFLEIAKSIASTKQIAYTPMATNLSSKSGRVFTPQIPGEADVATEDQAGHTFKNVNDPTTSATFSHSFALPDGANLTFNASTYDCNTWVGTGMYETHNGTSYQVTRCSNMTDPEPIDRENVSVYLDGDDATPLYEGEQGWWQTSINDTLNRTAGSNDDLVNWTSHEVTLESNQALVVYDFPDSTNSTNKMLVLYEIGLSENEAEPEGVIDIRVSNVEIGDD